MADPSVLPLTVAAMDAVSFIGLPEGRIPLAQAVIALALAPKSNAAYTAIGAAVADVRAGLTGPVPVHLRDASYQGAQRLGHGKGYRYAHDDPRGIVEQQYAPDALVGRDYYRPTRHGAEASYAERLGRLRAVLRGEDVPPAHDSAAVDEPSP
jgi:putative ATPase